MAKLTATDVAYKIGKSVYTVKRWYSWYEQLDENELKKLIKQGMPKLPKYEVIGNTRWRYWDEKDIEQIIKFRDWMPTTRAGVMGNFNRNENKNEK